MTNLVRGTTVQLNQTVRTATSTHQAGDTYKVLGTQGTCIRLSRTTDKAKLITVPEYLSPV